MAHHRSPEDHEAIHLLREIRDELRAGLGVLRTIARELQPNKPILTSARFVSPNQPRQGTSMLTIFINDPATSAPLNVELLDQNGKTIAAIPAGVTVAVTSDDPTIATMMLGADGLTGTVTDGTKDGTTNLNLVVTGAPSGNPLTDTASVVAHVAQILTSARFVDPNATA